MLLGPTGVGKTSVARAIHEERSPGRPFVRVALGALQPSTWRAELFGWRRGAFTGADRDGDALLAAAQGGTLFLDELGYVDPEVQSALLPVFDGDRRYRRVGDVVDRSLGADVIAAADRDLRQGFLAPLWHRLAGHVMEIPALAARREDILLLARLPAASNRVARKLLLHPWPGNVRQLVRVAGRLRDGEDLDAVLRAEGAPESPTSGRPSAAALRERIAAGATQAELARELGVHRSQITRWLQRG
jgi:two-component system nitrogen regulation response regulator GlnG